MRELQDQLLQQIDPLFLGLLILTLMMLLYMIVSSVMRKKPEERPSRIVSRISCPKGDYEVTRDFKEGEYVGAEAGKCPKCGSTLHVVAIYSQKQET